MWQSRKWLQIPTVPLLIWPKKIKLKLKLQAKIYHENEMEMQLKSNKIKKFEELEKGGNSY